MDPIDKLNEARRLQQALRENPNDVDSLVRLAVLAKEPDTKRKLLDHILRLEPVNQQAREMLLEMDRAEMSAARVPAQHPTVNSDLPSNDQQAKSLRLKYSIVHRFLVYSLLGITGLLSFMMLKDGEVAAFSAMGMFFLLLLLPLWFVSVVVEVGGSGIKVSRMFGISRREIAWNDIATMKPNFMGQGVKLSSAEGTSLKISSQLHGYPAIVEILLRIRPDLFNAKAAPAVSGYASRENPAASPTGTKIFQKSFFAKYGAFFLLVPACLISTGTIFVGQFLVALFAGIFLFFYWKSTLSAAHWVKVEENRLSTRSFVKQRELTAQQIKEISLVSLRTRRGIAKNFIQIEPLEGNAFRLSGFPEGNEIMYGFLTNWWRACQSQ